MLGLVALEFAAAVALTVVLIIDLLTQPATSLGTAVALIVVVTLAAVVLGVVLVAVWRGRAWVRSLGVVLQVLVAAIGIGALQGAFAQPGWAWPLILVGGVGFALFVSRPTAGWLSRRDEAA